MSQSIQLSSRISPIGTAQLHSAIERFKHVLDADQLQDFESSNDQPDAATVLKFTTKLDEINSERQSRCIATRLQTVLQSVQQFSSIVETFVSSNPRIAALVWGSLKFALLIASDFGSYFEKLSALFMKFGRHCPRYAEYQCLYLDSTRLQSCLCSFYATLVSCCTRAVETMKRPGWVQVTKIITLSSFESDFGPFEQELQHWSKEIKDEITAASRKADERERRAQSEERARAEDHRIWQWRRAKEQELEMEKLRSKKAITFGQAFRSRLQSALDTRSDWVVDSTSSLLCLTGKLGSGKTILTASAISELSCHPASAGHLAYFFCRFDNEASLHATTILSSLLKQILNPESLSPDQQSSLEKMLDPGPPELTGLESLLGDAISTTQFIVIDAFDECGEKERLSLLRAFRRIMDLPDRTIKLFLSSRDGDGWRTRKMFKRTHFVSTKLPESNFDLRTMVKRKLDELVKEERLVVGQQDIIQEIEDYLLSKAHGMFLWVDFALQDLCSQRRDCDIRAALERLPTGLPEMYDRLLGRILGSGERMLVSKTFHWIACAKRPLLLEELREAIAIEPLQKSSEPDRYVNNITQIPAWSHGLCICDEEDNAIQFAHSTVKDFLLGNCQNKANSDFHFDADIVDHELGEICVTYLNFSDFERQLVKRPKPRTFVRGDDLLTANVNATSGQTGTLSATVLLASELLRRTSKSGTHFSWPKRQDTTAALHSIVGSYPFLQYAIRYWIFHCKRFTQSTSTWSLWDRLLLSESSLVKSQWSPEEFSGRKECIQRFVEEQQHCGLLEWIQTSERRFEPQQLGEIFEYSITKCGPNWLAKKMFEWRETAPIACSRIVKPIEEGKIQMVLDLLGAVNVQKADLNAPSAGEYGRTALQAAIEEGHIQIVKMLLNEGADIDINDITEVDALSILEKAAKQEDLQPLMEKLLDTATNVNAPNALKQTALRIAAERGSVPMVKKLLNAGARAGTPGLFGTTALYSAAKLGHLPVVEALLNAGAYVDAVANPDPNVTPTEKVWLDGDSALHVAVAHGHASIVERLLNAGADANATGVVFFKETALQTALKGNHHGIAEMLRAKGAV